MAKFHSIQINDEKLYMAIYEYCRMNGKKINEVCTDMLKRQFMLEQYGDIPFGTMIINSTKTSKNLTVTDTDNQKSKEHIPPIENGIMAEDKHSEPIQPSIQISETPTKLYGLEQDNSFSPSENASVQKTLSVKKTRKRKL